MRNIFAVSVVALGVIGNVNNAFSADSYYLEIGEQGTLEQVNSQWEEISKKNKKLLGGLNVYPKSVAIKAGESVHVIQTGPVAEKAKADKICTKLFSQDVSCFVLEGAEGEPPSKSAGIGQAIASFFGAAAAEPAPWVDDANPKVLGSVSDDAKKTEQAEGKVDVAQAIPVPLSVDKDYEEKIAKPEKITNTKDVTETVKKTEPVAAPVVSRELSPVEFASGSAGWLDVSSFSSEKDANKFWGDVRAKFSDLTAGLRVRIKKSLGENAVHLNFGPFPSASDANKFCTQSIIAMDASLKCNFEVSGSATSEKVVEDVPVKYTHAREYAQRRSMLLDSSKKQGKTASKKSSEDLVVTSHETSEKVFWAQVVIADSKSEATSRIEEIQAANSDILGGVSSSITTSPMRHAKYNARLGPLATEQSATEICDTLQQRGVDCLVVSTK